MEESIFKWRYKTLIRLLATFILVIIPIYIFGFSFYLWGENSLRNDIVNSSKSQNVFFMSNFESDINNIISLQYDLVNDDDLNTLAKAPTLLDEIGKRRVILSLQKRLNAIKYSTKYIQDISIFIPAIDRTISAAGGTKQTIDKLDLDKFNEIKNSTIYSRKELVFYKNSLFISIKNPSLSIEADREPFFIIETELSKTAISNILEEYNNGNANTGYILISSDDSSMNDSIIIANSSNSKVDYEIAKQVNFHEDKLVNFQTTKYDYSNYLPNEGDDIFYAIGKKYIVTYITSNKLGMTLLKYTPEYFITNHLKKYQYWFVVFTFFAFTIILVYSFFTYSVIHKPLVKLVKIFKKVECGDFDVSIKYKKKDEFKYIYYRFNVMVENINKLVEQVYEQKIHAQKAELKQLQSQINPHFLYNSFFILNSMSRINDYDNLNKFTLQLGEYFQFVTRNASDEVTLMREVNHARLYTDIQVMRFSNRLKVEFEPIPKCFENLYVPRLIIQPIIENAFEHCLEKKSQNGVLVVSFEVCKNRLFIHVDDNGDKIDDNYINELNKKVLSKLDNIETTAIINIHRRLRIKFGEDSGLIFSRSEIGGLRVSIKIFDKEFCVEKERLNA